MESPLERARQWAQQHYPSAAIQRIAAFSNAVDYLVTGASGGYGGPSIREYLATETDRPAGQWSFEDAVKHCAPICFGPLDCDRAIAVLQSQHCFDDDPADLDTIRLHQLRSLDPERSAIVAAWLSGDLREAIALTERLRRSLPRRKCAEPGCGAYLSAQSRGKYCLAHRHKDPRRKEQVRRAKNR